MKKIVIGNLAHVDAGKTTLSEAMLFVSGKLKHLGRVDHHNAFLDYESLERKRKITIFSKQAVFTWNDTQITLLDTPGHIDFSSEMERVLQVLDVAVLIISGTEGVQPHTKTIWQLLNHYRLPTMVFINKMDMPQTCQKQIMEDIQSQLDERCINFMQPTDILDEDISLCDDTLLESYLEKGGFDLKTKVQAFQQRIFFPCFFGSALKNEAVDSLLSALTTYYQPENENQHFHGRIFKITHDLQGTRLTHLKVLSGVLKVKDQLFEDEKVNQIRIYNGEKYECVQEAEAGSIVAIKGIKSLHAGDVVGLEGKIYTPVLSSCMEYALILPTGIDPIEVMPNFILLSEEDPTLHVRYDHQRNQICMQLMGEIQIEVLKQTILERFGLDVTFAQGKVLYKETIAKAVLGVGHYEPLRHYAEVQLLLEPLTRGSGLVFETTCPEDVLSKRWQNLILTHLQEKEHLGVLVGAPITDMKITLLTGKAHLKHTEGGDFRQATYRAVRQGLMMSKSILLEPYYHYQAQVPTTALSRFIFDMENRQGTYEIMKNDETFTYLSGIASVRELSGYGNELISYTKGLGKIQYELDGYQPCLQQETIVNQLAYDAQGDLENPCDSIFCSRGAGYNVSYANVYQKMHLEALWPKKEKVIEVQAAKTRKIEDDDETLSRIFERTYGISQKKWTSSSQQHKSAEKVVNPIPPKKQCIIVDGYNVIFAWKELSLLAKDNLDVARTRLMDILCNYQGYKQCLLILVFDAYKVKEHLGTIEKYGSIEVVYTKEAQTADMFIERTTREIATEYQVSVVTSDALEQTIVIGQGATRISSREFEREVAYVTSQDFKEFQEKQAKSHAFPLEDLNRYQKKEN